MVEVLNETTAGCTNPPSWTDATGAYEIKRQDDSLAVYLNGFLLRRVYYSGSDMFIMDFRSDNMYGSGDHSHIFLDNVYGLEWKP